MSQYVPIGTYVAENEAQRKEASGQNDNVLSRSLRGGIYGAGSQLLSTGAAVADAVGADGVGGYLHGQSKSLRDTAALPGNAPRVGSYAQLRDNFSVDNLGEYVGGLVGGSLPITAAGIAGGLATGGAGLVPAMMGAGAATLPFNMGEVVQRQQSDPQAMQQGAGQRLLEVGLGGAGASAVESLVPGLVGRQLMGKGVGNLAKESFKQIAGRNALDIPLEGLTEGTGTGIKQFAANQDKPLDWNEIKEGAIGGAAAGSVFTGVGTAADVAHSIAPKTGEMLGAARTSINDRLAAARGAVGEKVDAAANTEPGKKVRGVFDDVVDMVDRGKQKFDDTLDKIRKGEELGSPADWLAATTDEAKKYMTEFSDNERVKAVTAAAKEMLDDVGLDATRRADIMDAMKNTGDRTAQTTIATLKKAWDLGKDGAAKIREFSDAVSDGYKKAKRADVDVESRTVDENDAANQFRPLGLPGAPKSSAQPAPTAEPAKMSIKEFAAARKEFIRKAMEADPELGPEGARDMWNASQSSKRDDTPKPPEAKLSEDYSGAHAQIIRVLESDRVAERVPGLFSGRPQDSADMVSGLRVLFDRMTKGRVHEDVLAHAMRAFNGEAPSIFKSIQKTLGADLQGRERSNFFANINRMMDAGEEADTLHEVMRRSLTSEALAKGAENNIAKDAQALVKYVRGEAGAERTPEHQYYTRLVDEHLKTHYGENADAVREAIEKAAKPAQGREEGADRLDENGAVVESEHYSEGGFDESGKRLEPATKDTQIYGLSKPNKAGNSSSQLNGLAMHKDSRYVKQHMLDVRAKFPGVDANGDYTHSVTFEQLPGSEYGHVVVEKYDNSKEFNETDMENMRLDTHKYPNSESRIDVGDYIIDAVKVAKTMRGKLQEQFEGGPTTAKGRLAAGFKHGLAMLMTQFDERIDVSDAAVIGYVNGKPLTWGEAQKLDKRTVADKENDFNTQEITQLRKEYQDAKAAGASPEVLKALVDAYKELVNEQAATKDKELGRGEDIQGRSVKRQRPPEGVRATIERVRRDNGLTDEVEKKAKFEIDEETGVLRGGPTANINGETQIEDGTRAKDKDGNIHALDDKSKPVFGGNDKNRVTRKPWGAVDRQDGPQIPANLKFNAKDIRNKREDLTPKDENIHRSNMDGSGHFVSPTHLDHNNLVAAVADWDGEASAGAAKLKARARTLLDNFAMMSAADQRRFTSIAPEDVKAGRNLKAKKFVPMTMAEARSIVNELATKYKDRILPAGVKAESVPTKQVTSHQRNPVQFYNDGKAGKRGPADPKPQAPVEGAARFGDKASLIRMQAEFPALTLRHTTINERVEITKHHDALAAQLGDKMPKVQGFSIRDGTKGDFAGKAVTRDGQHHILLSKELFDDTTPFLGSTADKVERATIHEVGHLVDRDDGHFSDNATSFKEGGRVYEELQALTKVSAYAHDWYGYAFDAKNPQRELFAQAFSAFHYNPEALKNAAPKTYKFFENYLGQRDEGRSGQTGRANNTSQPERSVSAIQEVDVRQETQTNTGAGERLGRVQPADRRAANVDREDASTDTAAKEQAFIKLAAAGDPRVLADIKAATDAKSVQRAIELLNDHEFDASEASQTADNIMDVYDALNARMAELVKDPDVALGLQTTKYSLDGLNVSREERLAQIRAQNAEIAAAHKVKLAEHELYMAKVEAGFAEGQQEMQRLGHEGRFAVARAEALLKRAQDNYREAIDLVRGPKAANDSYSLDSAEKADPNATHTAAYRDSVKDHITKVLGGTVKVAWKNLTTMQHAGDYTHALKLIRLSVHALDPMSTAYHESLHAFFGQLRDAGATDITKVLEKAASSQHVIDQLNERYKNQPAVLAQLADPEERAAYMYQTWASDPTFKINIGAKTVFQRIADFISHLMGAWTNDERALHIMEYFHSGEYAQNMSSPSGVRAALMNSHRSQILDTARSFTEPLGRLADAIVGTGGARLRDTGIPALSQLADIMKRDHTTVGGDQGFIQASRVEAAKMRTRLGELLGPYTKEMLADAMQALHSNTPAVSAEGRLAAREIKGFLKAAHVYMTSAGVNIGNLGPDYFPRVWDTHYISKNQQAFRDMLEPYIRRGDMKGTADDLIRSLTSHDGVELGIESREPGMQFKKTRKLDFITAQDAAQFVEKDLLATLSSYISQAARKAEWTRRLGGGKLEGLIADAKQQGATKEHLDLAETYMKGIDGTLGDDLNPTARRIMGDMIVYQNVRLLPMAAFSMLIDPAGVLVRGGTVTEAWGVFKRGMAGIKDTFKKDGGSADQATQWAELVGVVDSAMMSHAMSDVYSQGMVGGTAKKINNAFFKYNLVEGLNRNFRVGATEAAIKFLTRHAGGLDGLGSSAHSERWMKELGLQKGDVKLVGAHIALTQQEGLSAAQVQRVHAAINQWVDGAVLRPDAADKPIWMNDPHYALISHLKQFVFSFQKTILARVAHEFKNGNYTPMMALASYVPIMMAADAAKGVLVNAGDTPEWKKGWGPADYVGNGIERAGMLGVGQFGMDVFKDLHRGGVGLGALAGPTIEQMGDVVNTLGGRKQFGNTVIDALPANTLVKGWSGHGEAKADPVFVE